MTEFEKIKLHDYQKEVLEDFKKVKFKMESTKVKPYHPSLFKKLCLRLPHNRAKHWRRRYNLRITDYTSEIAPLVGIIGNGAMEQLDNLLRKEVMDTMMIPNKLVSVTVSGIGKARGEYKLDYTDEMIKDLKEYSDNRCSCPLCHDCD